MPTSSVNTTPLSTGKSILLVDDSVDNLLVFSDILQPHYMIRAAKNGPSALQLAARLPHPDLILLDIMMPGMDGYEVLRQLRSSPETVNIPVIFLTAMNAEIDEAKGLTLGAVDYISKPVIPELLLARVRTQLELKEARDWLMDRNAVLAAEVARQVIDLKAAKEAAETSSQSKSVFISTMSHELLTPMNGVIGMLQILEMSMPDEGSLRSYLGTAMESAQHMVELIRNILEYTDTGYGPITLYESPIDIRIWLEDQAHSWRHKSEQKQLSFLTQVGSNVPHQFVCDESRLKRILAILLDNALKFTAAGEIDVRVEATDIVLQISIRDTGIGIGNEVFERLFKPFEQGDGSISRSFGGTGLGLAFAKLLTDQMGGNLGCVSEVGKGSTFRLTLPLKTTQAFGEIQ